MASVTDYDLVESFTRNLYRNMLCHDSFEYEWMQKTSIAAHLMAMGAPRTTVLSAFLSRVLVETKIDAQTLAKFLDRLACDGDVILQNIVDITATHRHEHSPVDLMRKTRKDKDYARHHLFLADLLFKVKAYNRINVPLEDYRSKKVSQYVHFYERMKTDSLTRDLLQQIRVELATVEYLQEYSKWVQEKRKEDGEERAKIVSLVDRVQRKDETNAHAGV